MKKNLVFLGCMIICINRLTAQKLDSMMELYSQHFQQEKIHIQFDKSIYSIGETIWFKAYLMTGDELSEYSKNFYVDWFDSKGMLLSHTATPIVESSARGQFVVPEKYTGKLVHVKAYTSWMLNFDSSFLYNKDLLIDQPQAANAKNTSEKPIATIQFFPEGGDLVGGVTQRVAFLATNQYAIPVKVSGCVKNSRSELIDSFSTDHDGMGSFSLVVDAKEKYTIDCTDEYGISHTTRLPVTRPSAATLQVNSVKGKISFAINRSADAADNFKILNVIAHMNQREIYKSHSDFSSKTTGFGEISTSDLPTGILQITLFDANWIPVAERVVFVNNNHYSFEPTIKIIEKGLDERALNKIDVVVEDSVLSNMSISVTDGGLFNDGSNTIISQMLLAGDIKGFIYNPFYYFSSDADSVRQHLDLVMLTHGWRRFDWSQIINNKIPDITFVKETDYLQVKGTVTGISKSKLGKGNQFINLVLEAKDSSRQLLHLPLSASGTFVQKGAAFYDTIKIYYQFNGDKTLADRAEVSFQNGLTPSPSKLFSRVATSPLLWDQANRDSLVSERRNFFNSENLRLRSSIKSLPEVIVTTRKKSAKDVLDQKYTNGFFAGGDAIQFDIDNDPFAAHSPDVITYVLSQVAGIQTVRDSEKNRDRGEPRLYWRGGITALFLDEIPIRTDELRRIPMTQVAYVKVVRPPFLGPAGRGDDEGAGGAILVYTRKGGEVKNTSQGGNFKILQGYTKYKEFYSPDYKEPQLDQLDLRTTLYWNPFILTDKTNHVYHIEFYNNDVSKKLRIILEGVNSDGKLARIEKVLK